MAKDWKATNDEPAPTVDAIGAALDRLAAIAEAQAGMTQATAKRLAPKSLEVAEIAQTSPFNPRGDRTYAHLMQLKCDIYAPWKIDKMHHGCTREEVELFNRLTPGIYPITLNDDTPAKVTVIGQTNEATGAIERLTLQPEPSWTNEHRNRFRSMSAMLREMLGEAADGILTMKQEKAKIATGELAVSVNG